MRALQQNASTLERFTDILADAKSMNPKVFVAHCVIGTIVAFRAASAQSSIVEVPDAIACKSCRIERGLSIVLKSNQKGFSVQPTDVALDSRGRIWVAEEGVGVRVFRSSGEFEADVGRKGSGPDEYQEPFGFLTLPSDSMLVLDSRSNVAHVVSPQLRSVRRVRLTGFMFPLLPLSWPSLVAATGMISTKASIDQPLHLVAFAGADVAVTKSVRFPADPPDRAHPTSLFVRLAHARAGGFWTADQFAYRLTRWSPEGAPIQTLVRKPSWFAGRSMDWIGNPSTPAPPRIIAVVEDADGLIWVFHQVASPRWRDGWPTQRTTGEVATRQIAFERLFTTRIEVIDPKSARVVAETALDAFVPTVLSDGRAVVYATDDNDVRLSVVSFRLKR
ncbi:MAG: hypothetical protein IPP90_23190 [Gemmatimonadaceae bacterium]|nr:hypothetical protein [Gemmatimonadaceae bacterium]